MAPLGMHRSRLVLGLIVFGALGYLTILFSLFHQVGSFPIMGWLPRGSQSPLGDEFDRVDRLGETALGMAMEPECEGWNPHGNPQDDPPDCLRAKQFRELQEFRKMGWRWEGQHAEAQFDAISRLELCALGQRVCPERPLIIADYWYAFVAKTSTSGESIWLDPIVEAVADLGFAFFPNNHHRAEENWNLTRIFKHTLHQYWTMDRHAFQCLTNPRCVRQEDYVPHPNPALQWDLSLIPEHEFGQMPAWRVFAPTFWGTRPQQIGYPGVSPLYHWGQGKVDTMQEWSLHMLGQKWQFVPYDYPGHTWIPLSIEKTCLSAPSIDYKDRENRVLILAKKSSYFHQGWVADQMKHMWPEIISELKALGITLVSVANEEKDFPIPEGIENLGPQSKHDYEHVLAGSRAMLGIGRPEISPSPFNSMCAGVPTVLPYWQANATGWQKFSMSHQQHGPAMEVGEPYSYAYSIYEPKMLVEQIRKAVTTPIGSYIPPEMRLNHVRKKTADFLFHDWEAEYNRVLMRSGGTIPHYDPVMLEMCVERKQCADPGKQGEGGLLAV